MNRPRPGIGGYRIFMLLLAVSSPAAGSEIYHWVDEDGVRYFSDTAPKIAAVEVSRLTVTTANPPDYDPHEDRSSILSQAERTSARWSELSERRDERRKQRLEAAERASRLAPAVYELDDYYAAPFWYGPVHPGRFFHHRKSKVLLHRQIALHSLVPRSGRRPHSINSSAHLARIEASNEAFRAPRSLRPRHAPRHPGQRPPSERPAFGEP